MTNYPNNASGSQPDRSGFQHPEGYSEYTSATSGAVGDSSGYPPAYGAYEQTGSEFGFQAAPQTDNGVALAAMIVGIISLPLLLLFFPLAFVLGIVAVVLGVMGIRRAAALQQANLPAPVNSRKGMAIAGLALGVAAILFALAIGVVGFMFAKQILDEGTIEACEPYAGDMTALQECLERELGDSTGGIFNDLDS